MSATIVKANLRSTKSSESDMGEDCLTLACDNSYPAGGYPLVITEYISKYDFVLPTQAINGPFAGYYDEYNKKWIVTRGDLQVAAGTDLTFVDSSGNTTAIIFLIIARTIPGIRPAVHEPANSIASPLTGTYVAKSGDTVTGTLNIASTGGVTVTAGATNIQAGILAETPTAITESTIFLTSTRYTAAIADVSEISAVDGTPPDGTKIQIFFYDAGITVSNGGSFLNAGSVDFVSKAYDSIVWQYDVSVGKFVQCPSIQYDGTIVTYTGGYVKNEGNEIIPDPTPITKDAEVVDGTGHWTSDTGTPDELTNFAPPTTSEEKWFILTAGEAVRIMSDSAPGVTPGVYGNIMLGGYAWLDMNPGDRAYFRWDSGYNLWRLDHFIYA
jgi:hypothetical protein